MSGSAWLCAGDVTERVVETFFSALRTGDGKRAVGLALGLVDDGVPAERVLIDLVEPAHNRVGALWATGRPVTLLGARALPADGFSAAVAQLRVLLHDFPRAQACLDPVPAPQTSRRPTEHGGTTR